MKDKQFRPEYFPPLFRYGEQLKKTPFPLIKNLHKLEEGWLIRKRIQTQEFQFHIERIYLIAP